MTRTSQSLHFFAVFAFLAGFLATNQASACAVCFGDPESAQTQGMNMAILTMLSVTWSVLALFSAAAFFFWRRSLASETQDREPAETIATLEALEAHDG